MKVTIVKPDGIVGIDGLFLPINLSSLPNNLRVVQWDGTTGHIEWTDTLNTNIDSISQYQPIIDAWQSAKNLIDAKTADPTFGMTPTEVLAYRKAEIAAARYAIETAGVEYNGMTILTDRESQQILDSAIEKIRRGLVPALNWKCANGWIVIDSTNIAEIEILVLSHVQGAFAWEKSEIEKLED